jgi:hypothetical protein
VTRLDLISGANLQIRRARLTATLYVLAVPQTVAARLSTAIRPPDCKRPTQHVLFLFKNKIAAISEGIDCLKFFNTRWQNAAEKSRQRGGHGSKNSKQFLTLEENTSPPSVAFGRRHFPKNPV